MVPLSYCALFCFLVALAMTGICLYLNPRASLNRTMSMAGFAFAVTAFCYIWIYGASDKTTVWTFFYISTFGTSLVIPIAGLWADLLYARIPMPQRLFIALPFALCSIAFFAMPVFNPHFVYVDFRPTPWGNAGVLTPNLTLLYAGGVVLGIQQLVSWILLLRARARSSLRRVRQQIAVLVLGSISLNVLINVELAFVRTYHLPNLDLFQGLVEVGLLFFLIARYRYLKTEGATLEHEILKAMKEAVVLFEPDLRMRKVNVVTTAIFQSDERDLLSRDFASLFDQPDSVRAQWDAAVKAGKTTELVGISVRGSDVELVLAPSFDRFDDLVGGLALIRKNDIFGSVLAAYGITARERDVLLMLLQGYNRKEIAESKFIAPATVKNHIHNIYEKTGASNRVELLIMLTEGGKRAFSEKPPRS